MNMYFLQDNGLLQVMHNSQEIKTEGRALWPHNNKVLQLDVIWSICIYMYVLT